MNDLLSFLHISDGKRYLFLRNEKCPVEVVFREASKLCEEESLLIFKDQAVIKSVQTLSQDRRNIVITPYDRQRPPASQEFELHRGAVVPEEDFYDAIRMLVQGAVLKIEAESTTEFNYYLSDDE